MDGKFIKSRWLAYNFAVRRGVDCVVWLGGIDEFRIVIIDVKNLDDNFRGRCQPLRRTRVLSSYEELVNCVHLSIQADFGRYLSRFGIHCKGALNRRLGN